MKGNSITISTLDKIMVGFSKTPDTAKSINAIAKETGVNWMQARVAIRRLLQDGKLTEIENSNHIRLFRPIKTQSGESKC